MNQKLVPAIVLLAIYLFPALKASAQQVSLSDTKMAESFAMAVLPESPGGPMRRWSGAPRISCFGEPGKYKDVVQQFVAEMGIILDGVAAKPELIEDNKAEADITVYIDQEAKMQRFRVQEKASAGAGAWEHFAPDNSFQHYAIFAGLQRLDREPPGSQTQDLYRLLLQAVGFNSARMPGWAKSVGSVWGQAPSPTHPLSDFDKKLIRFSYQFLKSGMKSAEIGQLVRKNWMLVTVPVGEVATAPGVPGAPPAQLPAASPDAANAAKFLAAVLTNNGHYLFRKSPASPSYSCLGEASVCRPVLDAFLQDVRATLAGQPPNPMDPLDRPLQPTLNPDNDMTAEVTVLLYRTEREGENAAAHAAALPNPHIAQAYEYKVLIATPGFVPDTPLHAALANMPAPQFKRWQMHVRQPSTVVNGVFTFRPVAEDPAFRNEIIKSAMESLGFWRCAGNFDSVLCSPTLDHLTDTDKKFLRITYQYLRTGMSQAMIENTVRTFWR